MHSRVVEQASCKGVRQLSDPVLIAIIGLGGPLLTALASVITQVILNKRNREKRSEEETEKAKQTAIDAALEKQNLENRLARIEEKLDIHNGYAEKLTDVATSIAVIETNIKTLFKEAKAC